MKILIDARLYGLENSGIGRYTIGLIENLINIDTKNQYFILLRSKYYKSLSFPNNWTKVEADIPHYTLSEQYKLSKLINAVNPDLVHFLHFNVPINFKGKFVVTIHDLIMHSSKGRSTTTQPLFIYTLKRLGYKASFRKAVNGSSKIIAPSNFVAHEILNNYKISKEKVQVVYEGVEQRVDSPARLSIVTKYGLNNPYFIYTGNAYPHKNLSRAIEAIVQLNKETDQPILLAIVSAQSNFTKRLQSYIEKSGATNFVKMLGFVPDNDLHYLYKHSIGFLYPSLYEGFGLPGLEAFSSKTVVLASDIDVFKEIYQKAAIYFNPHDFTSITSAMKKVINFTPSERKEMLEKGKLQIKKYSWEKMARETLNIYETI